MLSNSSDRPRFILVVTLFLFTAFCSHSSANVFFTQDSSNTEIPSILDEEAVSNEYVIEDLIFRVTTIKLDINTAGFDELMTVPGIDSLTAQSILNYRNRTGWIFSIDEINQILDQAGSIPSKFREYFTTDQVLMKSAFKFPAYSPQTRLKSVLRYKNSEIHKPSPGSSPHKLFSRMSLNSENYGFNLIQEKDPYERNYMDYYSASIYFRESGFINGIIIGDYRMNFAKGLVMGMNYYNRKGIDPAASLESETSIRPNTSSNEYSALRGIATGFSLSSRMQLNLFASYNFRSAILDSNSQMTSFNESGYFITERDIKRKNNVRNYDLGVIMRYRLTDHIWGDILVLNSGYNKDFAESFSGGLDQDNRYVSISNTVSLNNLFADYEYAIKENGDRSFIASSWFDFKNKTRATLSIRNYSPGFITYKSTPFGESSSPYAERGIYTGISAQGIYGKISGYYDYYFFETSGFPGYELHGNDLLIAHSIRTAFAEELSSRIKFKEKEELSAEESIGIKIARIIEFRSGITTRLRNMKWKIMAAYLRASPAGKSAEKGIMFFNEITARFPFGIDLTGRFTFFETDSYSSGIYTIERGAGDLLDLQKLYGKGAEIFIVGSVETSFGIDISIKYRYLTRALEQPFEPGLQNSKKFLSLQISHSL